MLLFLSFCSIPYSHNHKVSKLFFQSYYVLNQLLYDKCSCFDALGLFFGFNEIEVNLYFYLVQNVNQTVSDLCDVFQRTQSTIYTALEKLVSHGIVTKRKRNRQTRGYEFLYSAVSPNKVKNILQDNLEKLYKSISSCLESFDADALSCDIPVE